MRRVAGAGEEHERALAVGEHTDVGSFRVDLASGRWWWSDEVYAMHGFERGEVVPSAEVLAAHKHPDDRVQVDDVVRDAVAANEPFSSFHRIVDADGRVRTVAVVGRPHLDDDGEPVSVEGFFVDITGPQRRTSQAEASEAIRAAAASRGVIEQAKGIVIAVLGGDEDSAFDALREAGARRGVRLRAVAEQLVAAVTARHASDGPMTTAALARLLTGDADRTSRDGLPGAPQTVATDPPSTRQLDPTT
ncbi:PAS and ANTAR domain-containing protein [Luteimicrobium sp. DT211]|uniref:PAS and ANTAR domain-containing protein n=1 Tax=Luteimicrobium sp. DT211 TaxID=3393412 RepID=UPI003CFB2FDC